jgi:parallel beta-helix repeat protein
MKRKWVVIGIILLFMGTWITSAIAQTTEISLPSLNGRTIYVDDDNTVGPWDGTIEHPYQHIQDGVDASVDTDVVFVFSGLYFENVCINTSINLTGENRETTIVDANYGGCAIRLRNSSGITINGFTLQHSGNASFDNAGINLEYMHNLITLNNTMIFHNILKENLNGIWIEACENSRFYDNLIEENYNNGFYGVGSLFNSIIFNNIIRNNWNYGIDLQDSSNNKINNNIIENNSIVNILLYHCLENKIINNHIAQSKYGIFVADRCWLNQIMSNNIIQNENGLHIETARYTIVKENNFIENTVHASFIGEFLLARVPTCWARNYWSNSTTPMKIKGVILIFIPNFSYYPFVIPIPWRQYDFFSVKVPYDIEV